MQHNKIDINILPHKNKKIIDWRKSIGYIVEAIYNNKKYKIKIINYENNYLTIKLVNEKRNKFKISPYHFKNCQLGNFLGLISKDFKYEIGTHIKNKKQDIIIVEREYRQKIDKHGWKENRKYYKYKCNKCGGYSWIIEGSLKRNGCNICSNNTVVKGINDMWTTNPELAELLANPEDGYKYTQGSGKRVDWRCPSCDNIIKNKLISNINKYGLSYPKCSDGISYPEKFVNQFLQQLLGNDFIYQLSRTTFKWCKNYKYDFYIPKYNIIIETHGIGHYQEGFKTLGGRTLQEEQKNDENKKQLAIKNNIKEENYIVIDCRKSELEWIKEHILNSRLEELFDLSKINWLECHEYACSSLIKKACDLWNSGIHNTNKIGKIMKLERSTIVKYLKQGVKSKWCDYDPKKVQKENGKKSNNCKNIKVIKDEKCIGIFKSMTELENKSLNMFGFKFHMSIISQICNNKINNYKGYKVLFV
jgi:hypothetical protein